MSRAADRHHSEVLVGEEAAEMVVSVAQVALAGVTSLFHYHSVALVAALTAKLAVAVQPR